MRATRPRLRWPALSALALSSLLWVGRASADPPVPPPELQSFYDQGKYKEGLDWLKRFGKGGPVERRYRGLFHHALSQPDPAIESLLPAYRADPKDDRVALALAEASLWKKDHKTALSVVNQLVAADAPEALRVRAMIFEQLGRLTEALALYERAIAGLKQPWGAMERKGQVLSWLKRFDDAIAVFRQIVSSQGASGGLKRRCRVHIAEITAWRKDFDGALAQLAALLAEEPRDVAALLLKGQILEWNGRYAEAKQTYSKVLTIDSNHREARLRLDKLLWVK